jgi:hypothetical protein
VAKRLFPLVNAITQSQITDKAAVKAIYREIPAEKREGIENRDGE